jgi:hypothetical protein
MKRPVQQNIMKRPVQQSIMKRPVRISSFTDLSVRVSYAILDWLRGWERAAACRPAVRICALICVKFCVQNVHAVWLVHYEFRESRLSESCSLLKWLSAHTHNSVLSEIRCSRFAPAALWVCDNPLSQGRNFDVAVNILVYFEIVRSCGNASVHPRNMLLAVKSQLSALHCTAPVHVTHSNLNCVYSSPCAWTPHWPPFVSSTVQTLVIECLMWVFWLTWQCWAYSKAQGT